jgi:hypothetical protein
MFVIGYYTFVANKHITSFCSFWRKNAARGGADKTKIMDVHISFQVFTAVSTQIVFFWVLTPCSITGASDVSHKRAFSKAVSL